VLGSLEKKVPKLTLLCDLFCSAKQPSYLWDERALKIFFFKSDFLLTIAGKWPNKTSRSKSSLIKPGFHL
jgi:hypothetical protein